MTFLEFLTAYAEPIKIGLLVLIAASVMNTATQPPRF